jgi:hypothetical protein
MTKRIRTLDEDLGAKYAGRVLSNRTGWFVVNRCWNVDGATYFDTDKFDRTQKYQGTERVYLHEARKYRVIEPLKVPQFLRGSCQNARR